jgi:hypothetical protein
MICRETEEMPRCRRGGLAVTTGAVGALILGVPATNIQGIARPIWVVE